MALEVTNPAGSISVVPSHTTVMTSTLNLPRSTSLSTSLISAVTVSLSLSPRVLLCALVLTHALHIQRCPSLSVSISVLQASLRPAYLLSLIAESEISQQQRRTIIQEPFFIFSPVLFHPSFVCALLFFFPPHRS